MVLYHAQERYFNLSSKRKEFNSDPNSKILVTYVWIDGSGRNVRSKTRVLPNSKYLKPGDLPLWSYDGSSTGQPNHHNKSDIILLPVFKCYDPFHPHSGNLIALCETYYDLTNPCVKNNRCSLAKKSCEIEAIDPWIAFEQEYTLLDEDGWPLGWPKNGFPGPQGPYYCGVGQGNAFGRPIVSSLLECLLYAGLTVSGDNAEVLPSQWEYQIGPCTGIEAGDQLWVSRYILTRVAEDFGVKVTFDPKPVPGDWNCTGCHLNFSTARMREENGLDYIIKGIEQLENGHKDMIKVSDSEGGQNNKMRLSGHLETSSFWKFNYGIADRSASIRIPLQVSIDKRGYFEDRRPAGDCDPYLVIAEIIKYMKGC